MVDIHPKHTFVDEYPHLVYDGENDATLDDASFTLPTASADTLGGVKVGDGLSISDSGVLSASGGGGGGGLVVNCVVGGGYGTLDKTFAEIKTAMQAGIAATIVCDEPGWIPANVVTVIEELAGEYTVNGSFTTDSVNGYPAQPE